MAQYFDRYGDFRVNSEIKPLPGILIEPRESDKTMIYKLGLTRLDKLSQMYYNNAYSGWLIMLANPQYGGLEFNITDMAPIRVPYPYDSAIERYIKKISNHKILYGE